MFPGDDDPDIVPDGYWPAMLETSRHWPQLTEADVDPEGEPEPVF